MSYIGGFVKIEKPERNEDKLENDFRLTIGYKIVWRKLGSTSGKGSMAFIGQNNGHQIKSKICTKKLLGRCLGKRIVQ
jgi:hypothetical protein